MSEILFPDFRLLGDTQALPRLVIGVDGREKQGKTHFACTGPGPIAYLDFDMGTEGVVEKFKKLYPNKLIIKSKPFVVRSPDIFGGSEKKAGEEAEPEWKRFHEAYIKILTEPIIKWQAKVLRARTMVIDTGTEEYELLRLAHFGKLVQVPTFKYRETNAIMRDLVRHALDHDVNVIFLHKLKAEWAKGSGEDSKQSKTGAYERAGFEEMAHLVQANVFCYRAPVFGQSVAKWKIKVGTGEAHTWTADPREETGDLGFRLRVLDSRHNPEIDGLELRNDQIDFGILAQMMLPESDPQAWEDVTS